MEYMLLRESPELNCVLHINSELEVVYVSSGKLIIKGDHEVTEVCDNEAAVILPYRLHGFTADDKTDAKVFLFSNGLAEDFFNMYNNNNININKFTVDEILGKYILTILEKDYRNTDDFYVKSMFFAFISEYINQHKACEMINENKSIIREIMDYISKRVYAEEISLEGVSKSLGINQVAIRNVFKNYLGMKLSDFVNIIRIEKAVSILESKDMSVTDIAYECGFGSVRNFNRIFQKRKKCSPTEYKRKYIKNKK